MADEYIRREDVLKGKKTGTFANGICFVAEPCVTVEYIKSLEPADVVPVVHSEWIYHMSYGVCKKCGYEYEWKGTDVKNYCPNCGAKMDGEE